MSKAASKTAATALVVAGKKLISPRNEPFDYSIVAGSLGRMLREHALTMHRLIGDARQIFLQMGGIVDHVASTVDRPIFEAWLDGEFGMSPSTAWRLRQAFRRFGQLECCKHFDTGAMYELAGPGVPQSVRDQAFERARRGESIHQKDAREMIRNYRLANGLPLLLKPRHDADERLMKEFEKLVAERGMPLPATARTRVGERLLELARQLIGDTSVVAVPAPPRSRTNGTGAKR